VGPLRKKGGEKNAGKGNQKVVSFHKENKKGLNSMGKIANFKKVHREKKGGQKDLNLIQKAKGKGPSANQRKKKGGVGIWSITDRPPKKGPPGGGK